MNSREDITQRVECMELRMRLEEIADMVVQEMFDLPEPPFTTRVDARITAILGRLPDELNREHWAIIASARHTYHQLCDVIHGRSAWTRVPRTQLAGWVDAVHRFEVLGRDIGLAPD